MHPAHSPARIILFSASFPNFIWGGEVRAPGRVRAPYYTISTSSRPKSIVGGPHPARGPHSATLNKIGERRTEQNNTRWTVSRMRAGNST